MNREKNRIIGFRVLLGALAAWLPALAGAQPISPEFLANATTTSNQNRQQDSGAVKFAGGNPWALIGTWSDTVP